MEIALIYREKIFAFLGLRAKLAYAEAAISIRNALRHRIA
jgi:hypothetical protein